MITEVSSHTNNKYARLTKRDNISFQEVDNKIRQCLIDLEKQDNNLWSSPEYNKNEFIHSIFAYPAMMVPEVQRQIMDVIFRNSGSQNITSMIDPFMGSSTSLISSMHYGIDCYGQDINPLAVLISKVRTSLVNVDFKRLKSRVANFTTEVANDASEEILVDFKGINKWFKKSTQIALSRLVRTIRLEEDVQIRRFYWANLAEVIRISSNDRTSTYKLHARPLEQILEREVHPIPEMAKQMEQSLSSYAVFKSFLRKKGRLSARGYSGKINIRYGDSADQLIFNNVTSGFAKMLVSSPPYGDNHTTVPYGQYSYLQLQWLDLKDIDNSIDENCIKSTAEIDSISVGGRRTDKNIIDKVNHICNLSPSFSLDYETFRHLSRDRYYKIVIFLHDLDRVVNNSLEALAKDSYMIWTMGDRSVGNGVVRNVQYLKEMLESKGCEFVHSITRTILNKRMAKRNSSSSLMNTEEIIIYRKK